MKENLAREDEGNGQFKAVCRKWLNITAIDRNRELGCETFLDNALFI